ncbi:MAG: DNA/RNA nuclease SfsA [Crenarchaeota archaeon]|nr:DNA/RNA nuclease SfsA [Thermoproteota archaeon]
MLELPPLQRCRLLRRPNRFVVEAEAPTGGTLRLHNTNTGRLLDVLQPGAQLLCLPHPRPGRRTQGRLIAARYHGGWALLDTRLQEQALQAAIEKGLIPPLRGCRPARRSPRLEDATLDLQLECPNRPLYLEAKSAVLASSDGYALYPDAPSPRAHRQILALTRHAHRGGLAAVVFLAAFPGARGFRPNRRIDPQLPSLLREAQQAGVLIHATGLDLTRGSGGWRVRLYSPSLPLDLEG